MLNALRMGNSNTDIVAHFKRLSRPVVYSDGIEATELYDSPHNVIIWSFRSQERLSFPTRAEVERANTSRLRRLGHPIMHYPASDTAGPDVPDTPLDKVKKLLSQLVASEHLELRVRQLVPLDLPVPLLISISQPGAQVMMIKVSDRIDFLVHEIHDNAEHKTRSTS